MSLTTQDLNSIYELYPQVVTIRNDVAYDANDNEVTYDLTLVTAQASKNNCKTKASALLYATDWTTIPDVANTENNPYLTNQPQFIVWRNQIRELAVNPVENPTWPTQPQAIWSS